MKPVTNTTNTKTSNHSKASTEKQEEREFWHKIVVKVLRWKEIPKTDGQMVITEKITTKEWNFYHKATLKINSSDSRGETLKKLNLIKQMIAKNGGFEEKI